MIKVLITKDDGELLESLTITAEQSHLMRTDWTGDYVALARAVVETITNKYNVEED